MKARGITLLVFCVLVIFSLTLVAGFGVTVKTPFSGKKMFYPGVFNSEYGFARGVLSAGGSVITLATEEDADKEMKKFAFEIIGERLERLGYVDKKVYKTGSDEIKIEIPGVLAAADIARELSLDYSLSLAYASGEDFLLGTTEFLLGAQPFPFGDENAGDEQADGEFAVGVYLTDAGRDKLAEASEVIMQAEEDEQYILIKMGGEAVSAPRISEKIETNQFSITADFSEEEAGELAIDIMNGLMPVEVDITEAREVSAGFWGRPGLSVLIAALIGILLLFAALIILYRLAGAAAVLTILSFLSLLTMGLSGYLWPGKNTPTVSLSLILGILLMAAISAGSLVLILERALEELRRNKGAGEAFAAAFKRLKGTFWEIMFITLVLGAVLYFFGGGRRDFAIVLMAGAPLSLITTGLVMRLILGALVKAGFSDSALIRAKTEGSAK